MNLRKQMVNRIYGLDILRCYAVLLVLWVHSTAELLPPFISSRMMAVVNFDPISLFFVLSGYLIGMILIKRVDTHRFGLHGLLNFFRQRFLRSFPLYFFMLIVYIILSTLLYDHFSPKDSWPYFLFLQNFRSNDIYFFEESWSLSVEIWFYVFTAITIFIVLRFKNSVDSIAWAGAGIIIGSLAVRCYKYGMHPPKNIKDWLNDYRTIVSASVDYPVYGLMGAWVQFKFNGMWEQYKKHFLVGGLVLMALINLSVLYFDLSIVTSFVWCVFSNTLFAFCILLFLPFLNSISGGKGFIYRAVTYISLRSYSLYLVHATLIINMLFNTIIRTKMRDYGIEYGLNMSLAFYISFWIIVFPIANLTYNYIEIPFMNLRKRTRFTSATVKSSASD